MEIPIKDGTESPTLDDNAPADPQPDPVETAPEEPKTEADPEAPKGGQDRAAELWDKLVRLSADFDNYKKRMGRERSEAIRYANTNLLESLLPILDNLEMAVSASDTSEASASQASVESLQKGVQMVVQQFKSTLEKSGLVEIDATDQAFDPNFHEAVSQLESADVPEGHVIQQLRKGYKLHDRLVRPASVIVAKAPSAAPSDSDAGSEQ